MKIPRCFVFLVAALLCAGAAGHAQMTGRSGMMRGEMSGQLPGPVQLTKETAPNAIAAFRADPLTAWNDGTVASILAYARGSGLVNVDAASNALPYLGNKVDETNTALLRTAYVAGELGSLLGGQAKKDAPLAGAQQVIETYQLLKKTQPALRSPGIEQWILLDQQGRLREELGE